jgi:ribonuclease HI
MPVYVYTDGSCRGNGKATPLAGIGVFFGEGDSRNVSSKLLGKQTNNAAELAAVIAAFELIRESLSKGHEHVIVTDSEYVIKCMTSYGKRCALAGWTKEIPNKELVRKAYHSYAPYRNVSFMHVMAHTKSDSPHARGNAEADRLANEGALSSVSEEGLGDVEWDPSKKIWNRPLATSFPQSNRVDLKVPYAEKEEAKRMGARWDPSAKVWHTVATNIELIERFSKN